jgi:tetratricopeptide (TPR) repeat protein
VLLTAHGGVNFYVGNGPGATGRYRSVLAGPHGLEGQIAKSRTKAESHAGRPLRSSEVSSYWYGRSFDHMLKAPGSWVLLLCKKTLLLINAWEVPLNYDYEFHKGYASLLRAPLPGFGFVWPLAVMGFILSLTGPRFGTREAAFAGVYGLTLVAFYVSSRYRIPMVAALLPFAGYGLVAGWEALRSMALTRVTLALGAAALAAGVVSVPFPRGEPSASYRALGGIHAAQKDLLAAEKAYRKALAFDPSSSATSNNLANVLRRQGRLPEAEELYRRAVEADPGNAQAWNNLGVCLLDTGDIFGAEEAFLEAREVDGAYLTPLRNLIRLYERNDMTEEARRLREELRRRSGQR